MVWKLEFVDCDLDLLVDLSLSMLCSWLIFMDDIGLGCDLFDRLCVVGYFVIEVFMGDVFGKLVLDCYVLVLECGCEGYD